MMFEIGVANQKKKFLLSMRRPKFQKKLKCIKNVYINISPVCKNINLFQKNPAEKCSVP